MTNKKSDFSTAKQAAGHAAAELVEDGMVVGLGTGSTAECFIRSLIERWRGGLRVKAVATSQKSMELASQAGIPIVPNDELVSIDLTVDGADEITMHKQMIKGGGAALLREKIVAAASTKIIIVVDETKVVKHLGAFPLPVEIVPFAYRTTLKHLESFGYHGKLRYLSKQQPVITDNGNYIVDIHFTQPITHPETEHKRLCTIPGVVETGLFFNLPIKMIVGFFDGHTKTTD